MTKKEKFQTFINNTKTKIISLKTNYTFLICCLLTFIYLTSGYWKWLEIGVSLCALVFMIFLPIKESFCVFMYLHCFTRSNIGYDSCFMVTLIGYCIILLVKYIIGVKKKQYPVYKKLLISIIVFYVITTAISLFKPIYMGSFLYYVYLPIAYLILCMRKDISISKGMNYMFGGLVASCLLAIIFGFIPYFQYPIIPGSRFQAFLNNTNYLYIRAIFILCYYMFRFGSNKISSLKFLTIFLICSIISLSTKSKTGIAMLALMTVIFIIAYLAQDFKKRIKIVSIFLVVLTGVCLVGYKFIIETIQRFISDFSSKDIVNSLLTFRDEIWIRYLYEICRSPWTALFGHGILKQQIFIAHIFGHTETHNFYLFLLYRFGIIGTVGLGYIVSLFVKCINKEKPKFIAYLPLIFILLEGMCDNTFKCYNFTYYILAIAILFIGCKEKPQKPELKDNKNENNKNNDELI